MRPVGRPTIAVFLLSLVAVLAGCGQAGPTLPSLAPDAVVLAFGDSLTYGTGARPQESYPAVLAELIGRRVINAGKPGEPSAQGLARLPAALDDQAPALLILCHGGNDLLRRRSFKETEANLRQMVASARERAVAVLLLGVPRPGIFLSAADFYERVARDHGLPYQGEVIAEILSEPRLKSDAVHPNADGYRMLAEAVAALLHESGAIQASGR